MRNEKRKRKIFGFGLKNRNAPNNSMSKESAKIGPKMSKIKISSRLDQRKNSMKILIGKNRKKFGSRAGYRTVALQNDSGAHPNCTTHRW